MEGETGKAGKGISPPEKEQPKKKIRLTRFKTEALLIRRAPDKEQTYADLFRQITKSATNKLVGLQMVRRSRTRDLLIEVARKADIGPIHDIVEQAIGNKERVRTLQQKWILELRGLDPVTEDNELKEDLAKALKLKAGMIEVKSVRVNNNDRTRTGIFVIPVRHASAIKEGDRIKIGYVATRVRIFPDIVRCFRCYHFGHTAIRCLKIMEGREICRRCGNEDHIMVDSKAQVCSMLCAEANMPLNRLGHVAGAIT